MAYIGQSLREGTMQTYSHVAVAGQVSFPCSYGVGSSSVSVFQNGVLLSGSDINLTSGNAAVLNVAAAAGDEITIQVQDVFSVADTVSAANGGTFTGNVSMSGTLGVTGAITAANGLTVDDDGATPLTVDRATDDGAIIDVQKDGTSVGSIGTYGGDMTVGTGDTRVRFIDSLDCVVPVSDAVGTSRDAAVDLGYSSIRYKDLYLSGGVYLGGTGAANHLDDYEEGTWTPTILATTSNPSPNYVSRIGEYRKIGKFLYVNCYIYATSLSGGQGGIRLGGLPFGVKGTITGGYPFLMAGYFHMGGQSAGVGSYNTVRWQANASPVTHLDWYGTGGTSWSTGAYEISATGVLPIV